jgi:hypothetical protein
MSQITTKETAAGMGAVTNIAGNTGTATPVGGVINVISSTTQGTPRFVASGSTNTLSYTGTNSNTGIGTNVLANPGGAINNTALGSGALSNVTTGGNSNVAIGVSSLAANTTGAQNVAVGTSSLTNATAGVYNTALGNLAGIALTGGELSNICIGYNANGVAGQSNRLQIGAGTGTGSGALNKVFIYGIDGINVGSVAKIATINSDQLGSATLTAGTGVSIVPGANTITLNATGGGLSWTVVTGTTQAAAVNNGYIANNAGTVTITLPATAAVGSIIRVTGINNATGWLIAQNAGQTIRFGTLATTTGVAGSLQSTATRDAVELLCVVANTTFQILSSIGNITVV